MTPAPPQYASLWQRFDAQLTRTPTRPFLFFVDERGRETEQLSLGELEAAAQRIAYRLTHKLGLRAGDRALLVYPPSLDFTTALLGCLMIGVVPVPVFPPNPLNLQQTMRTFAAIAEDCGAEIALTNRTYAQARWVGGIKDRLTTGASWPKLDWQRTDHRYGPRLRRRHVPTNDELALLQYTSGSTSAPKGVMITHGNLAHQLEYNRETLGLSEASTSVLWVPHFHDFGLISGIISSLMGNGRLYMMSPLTFIQRPAAWLELMSRVGATHTAAPNFAYELALRKTTAVQRASWDLGKLEVVMSAAEPIQPSTVARFKATYALAGLRPEAFCPAYGLAEHTVGVTVCGQGELDVSLAALEHEKLARAPRDAEASKTLVACGTASMGVDLRIVEPETGRELAEGKIGEIWVDSASKAAGYWGREAESEASFNAQLSHAVAPASERGYLRTGDLGFVHEGQLYVCGRLKDLIIIRGRNVYPQDLESSVEACHPAIRPGCIAAFGDSSSGLEELVIVAELKREQLPSSSSAREAAFAEVAQAIREVVGAEHQLGCREIVLIEARTIAKTTSGKIQRARCKASWRAGTLEQLHVARSESESPAPPSHRADADERPPAEPDEPALDEAHEPQASPRPSWLETLGDHTHAQRLEQLAALIAEQAAAVLGEPANTLSRTRPLQELGLDSVRAVELRDRLAKLLEHELPATLAFDAPTIEGIADYLLTQVLGENPSAAETSASVQVEPIAVIGMACRLPGEVREPEQLARLLAEGVDAITEVPASRWEVDPDRMRTRWGGFVSAVDTFDARFFGLSAREADYLDPQQRLLLECCWEALERARVVPEQLAGTATGVYVGLCGSEYQIMAMSELDRIAPHALLGGAHSTAAGRISYTLGLEGPSVALDTACSSSLVAVHLACQAIRAGECSSALAGGVNLLLAPHATVGFSQLGAMSPSGRCKAFSADADGYVRSEGCGIVMLKSLAAAQRDGDPILGVILGSAVNQDGRSNGLSAPRGPAQAQVIRRALSSAGVEPEQVDYVECHGTGTPLGDPIELGALSSVFAQNDARTQPLVVGSIKTNIGHTEAAAGVAGLLKVLCALRSTHIPSSLHAERLNPHVDWDQPGIAVAHEPVAWPREQRIAGVSSFGFSGTNAHLVVAAPPPSARPYRLPTEPGLEFPVLLSAKSPAALRAQAQRLLASLPDDLRVADLAMSLATTRTHFEHRAVILAARPEQLRAGLEALSESRRSPHLLLPPASEARRHDKLTLLFSGQGSQRAGMGRDLYESCPPIQDALERLADGFAEHLDPPLLEVMFAPRDSELAPRLHETAYTQAALFVLEVALAQLWIRWGLRPDFLLGHSIGEIAAACIAGVVSEADGCRMVAARGRLMQELPAGGAMASLQANEDEVRAAIVELGLLDGRGESVSIAALNTPRQVVISGERGGVERLMAHFAGLERATTALDVSHAFHSHQMDAMLGRFGEALAELELAPPQLRLVSNVHGELADAHELAQPDYWVRHVREPVRFADGLARCLEQGSSLFVELGPQALLTRLGEACAPPDEPPVWLSSQRRGRKGWSSLLQCLAQLHLHGVPLAWGAVFEDLGGEPLALPTYAFERSRHWLPAHRFVGRGARVGVVLDPLCAAPQRDALLELLAEDKPGEVRLLDDPSAVEGLDALLCLVDPPLSAHAPEQANACAQGLWTAHQASRDASPPLKLVLVSSVPRGRAADALSRFGQGLFNHRQDMGLPTFWVDAPPRLHGTPGQASPLETAPAPASPVPAVPVIQESARATPAVPAPPPAAATPAPATELCIDPNASGRELERQIVNLLRSETARLLECSVAEVSVHTPLTEQGFDSLLAAELRPALERGLGGLRVPASVAFDHPTILDQAAHLRERVEAARSQDPARAPEASDVSPESMHDAPAPPSDDEVPPDDDDDDDEFELEDNMLMSRLTGLLAAETALDSGEEKPE